MDYPPYPSHELNEAALRRINAPRAKRIDDDELVRRQVHLATNQVIFREINEQLEELNDSFSEIIPLGDFVCECADTNCTERIGMTIPQYEQLRAHATRFAVRKGHLSPEAERIVQEEAGYMVVEMVGAAGAYAARFDPRTRH
jgi:hypothetical protein